MMEPALSSLLCLTSQRGDSGRKTDTRRKREDGPMQKRTMVWKGAKAPTIRPARKPTLQAELFSTAKIPRNL